jgi:hypothetical protein
MKKKIKDSIGLKELESFGFKVLKNGYFRKDISVEPVKFDDGTPTGDFRTISIGVSPRREVSKMVIRSCLGRTHQLYRIPLYEEDIQDLIQAGFIEEIEVNSDEKED